jgi:hypothetical protein
MLHVRRDQGRELWRAFEIWQSAFWQPATINREFADHFRSRTFGGGFIAACTRNGYR